MGDHPMAFETIGDDAHVKDTDPCLNHPNLDNAMSQIAMM